MDKIYIVEEWDMEGGYAKKAFTCKEKAESFAKQCKKENIKQFRELNKCTWAFAQQESNDYHIREVEVE